MVYMVHVNSIFVQNLIGKVFKMSVADNTPFAMLNFASSMLRGTTFRIMEWSVSMIFFVIMFLRSRRTRKNDTNKRCENLHWKFNNYRENNAILSRQNLQTYYNRDLLKTMKKNLSCPSLQKAFENPDLLCLICSFLPSSTDVVALASIDKNAFNLLAYDDQCWTTKLNTLALRQNNRATNKRLQVESNSLCSRHRVEKIIQKYKSDNISLERFDKYMGLTIEYIEAKKSILDGFEVLLEKNLCKAHEYISKDCSESQTTTVMHMNKRKIVTASMIVLFHFIPFYNHFCIFAPNLLFFIYVWWPQFVVLNEELGPLTRILSYNNNSQCLVTTHLQLLCILLLAGMLILFYSFVVFTLLLPNAMKLTEIVLGTSTTSQKSQLLLQYIRSIKHSDIQPKKKGSIKLKVLALLFITQSCLFYIIFGILQINYGSVQNGNAVYVASFNERSIMKDLFPEDRSKRSDLGIKYSRKEKLGLVIQNRTELSSGCPARLTMGRESFHFGDHDNNKSVCHTTTFIQCDDRRKATTRPFTHSHIRTNKKKHKLRQFIGYYTKTYPEFITTPRNYSLSDRCVLFQAQVSATTYESF
mmetsp:Transcript_20204/g.26695  ORF Transcript_20204/g.26695 Transcript_20204/m.26695 type:complete len:585 (-) Transcript_20204:175-1929(-)